MERINCYRLQLICFRSTLGIRNRCLAQYVSPIPTEHVNFFEAKSSMHNKTFPFYNIRHIYVVQQIWQAHSTLKIRCITTTMKICCVFILFILKHDIVVQPHRHSSQRKTSSKWFSAKSEEVLFQKALSNVFS